VRSCEIHTSTDAPGDETRLDELGRRQDQKLAELQSWQQILLGVRISDDADQRSGLMPIT